MFLVMKQTYIKFINIYCKEDVMTEITEEEVRRALKKSTIGYEDEKIYIGRKSMTFKEFAEKLDTRDDKDVEKFVEFTLELCKRYEKSREALKKLVSE